MNTVEFYRHCWVRGLDWRGCKSAGHVLTDEIYLTLDQDAYEECCDILDKAMRQYFLKEMFGE